MVAFRVVNDLADKPAPRLLGNLEHRRATGIRSGADPLVLGEVGRDPVLPGILAKVGIQLTEVSDAPVAFCISGIAGTTSRSN